MCFGSSLFCRFDTCAVVGNAGHLILKEYGPFIDQYGASSLATLVCSYWRMSQPCQRCKVGFAILSVVVDVVSLSLRELGKESALAHLLETLMVVLQPCPVLVPRQCACATDWFWVWWHLQAPGCDSVQRAGTDQGAHLLSKIILCGTPSFVTLPTSAARNGTCSSACSKLHARCEL